MSIRGRYVDRDILHEPAAACWTCPHCGNANVNLVSDNGGTGYTLTLLCLKPLAEGECDSFDRDRAEALAAGDTEHVCGMQWDPYDDHRDEFEADEEE